MLKIKFVDETAETNPFVQLWTVRGEVTGKGRRLESQGAAGYVFMMAVSGVTCLLALILSGYGLYQITRPALSLVEGLTLATLGGIILIGSIAALQILGAKVYRILSNGQADAGEDGAAPADR